MKNIFVFYFSCIILLLISTQSHASHQAKAVWVNSLCLSFSNSVVVIAQENAWQLCGLNANPHDVENAYEQIELAAGPCDENVSECRIGAVRTKRRSNSSNGAGPCNPNLSNCR